MFPKDVINAFLYQLEVKEPSAGAKYRIQHALLKQRVHSMCSSPKILRACYQYLLERYFDNQLVLYIQHGSVYIASSQVKKMFLPAMDVEDIQSLLLDQASKAGNPVAQFYKHDPRPADQKLL